MIDWLEASKSNGTDAWKVSTVGIMTEARTWQKSKQCLIS